MTFDAEAQYRRAIQFLDEDVDGIFMQKEDLVYAARHQCFVPSAFAEQGPETFPEHVREIQRVQGGVSVVVTPPPVLDAKTVMEGAANAVCTPLSSELSGVMNKVECTVAKMMQFMRGEFAKREAHLLARIAFLDQQLQMAQQANTAFQTISHIVMQQQPQLYPIQPIPSCAEQGAATPVMRPPYVCDL